MAFQPSPNTFPLRCLVKLAEKTIGISLLKEPTLASLQTRGHIAHMKLLSPISMKRRFAFGPHDAIKRIFRTQTTDHDTLKL